MWHDTGEGHGLLPVSTFNCCSSNCFLNFFMKRSMGLSYGAGNRGGWQRF